MKKRTVLILLANLIAFCLILILGCEGDAYDIDESSNEADLLLKIQGDLPPDWTCTVIMENGKKGHPHGLD